MRRMMGEWVVFGEGICGEVVEEAPVEVEGWRPWVKVRALTEAEALEREGLGLWEEYELVARGIEEPAVSVRRAYDLRAMAEYDYVQAVVDYCLPEMTREGVRQRLGAETTEAETVEFLGRMQPCLAAWVHEVIERVNWRRPEQRATLEMAKKS